jgi:hypothetical protein
VSHLTDTFEPSQALPELSEMSLCTRLSLGRVRKVVRPADRYGTRKHLETTTKGKFEVPQSAGT